MGFGVSSICGLGVVVQGFRDKGLGLSFQGVKLLARSATFLIHAPDVNQLKLYSLYPIPYTLNPSTPIPEEIKGPERGDLDSLGGLVARRILPQLSGMQPSCEHPKAPPPPPPHPPTEILLSFCKSQSVPAARPPRWYDHGVAPRAARLPASPRPAPPRPSRPARPTRVCSRLGREGKVGPAARVQRADQGVGGGGGAGRAGRRGAKEAVGRADGPAQEEDRIGSRRIWWRAGLWARVRGEVWGRLRSGRGWDL